VKIAQVMNALDRADAVSQHLLEMDRMFRELGHTTEIYSEFADASLVGRRRPVEELADSEADVLLLHWAGYTTLLGLASRFRGRKGVVYHNVTPSEFFRDVPATFDFCEKGRRQVAQLADVFTFAIANSAYSARELGEAGLVETRVIPLPWEASGIADAIPASLPDGGADVVVVGRVAPHKGIHTAVAAFPELERRLGRSVRLDIVGRKDGHSPYVRGLEQSIERMGAGGRIRLVGEVGVEELRARFESAGALLVVSEHEGFCVPIAEAHGLGVPVVAHDAAAIAETLGDGGILLPDREPGTIAEALVRVLPGGADRERILERQRARRERFSRERVLADLDDALGWIRSLPSEGPTAARLPTFSVVVCTYNRDWVLEKCLQALRRLDYPDYEVVVVNGPSTDGTDRILDRFPEVKRVENAQRNLSISRNLGIAASAGEIVAFIDDDAMPGQDWLHELAEAYRDPRVGGAGGHVYGPGGNHLQFDRGIISRWSLPRPIRDEPAEHNAPHGEWFNILMGTNCSFRRSVLEEIGGFDENYEYYHDESDVCVRVIRAGYRVEHVPNAPVWHEFEKSRIRRNLREMNWFVIVKNTLYFYFKLNPWKRRPWDALQPMRACLVHLGSFSRWFVHGEIGPLSFAKALLRWKLGLVAGYAKGAFRAPRRRLAARSDDRSGKMQRCQPTLREEASLHVVLVSQQYPPNRCGGVGVYTEALARGLVEAGHRVEVVAAGSRETSIWRDGVLVHRAVSPRSPRGIPFGFRVTRRNAARAVAVARKIREIHRRSRVDLVEAPLWDAESYATLLLDRWPVLLRMTTPLAMAMETQGWDSSDDLESACRMEWTTLQRAHGTIDTSGATLPVIAERWGVRAGGAVRIIPFGITLPDPRPRTHVPGAPVRFLFVGRLEPRKGIDILLEAMKRVVQEGPEVELLVAGDRVPGEDPERILAGHPAARCVRFLGRVKDDELHRLYAECDVFVAPSRFESFGIVYIEAFSHATPVVAANVGGAARVIRDGKDGLLVPADDEDALADAMLRMAREPEERRRMGEAARKHAEEEFTVEVMVHRSVAFYREILDGGASVTGESLETPHQPILPLP
jgi:hypothetical protein